MESKESACVNPLLLNNGRGVLRAEVALTVDGFVNGSSRSLPTYEVVMLRLGFVQRR